MMIESRYSIHPTFLTTRRVLLCSFCTAWLASLVQKTLSERGADAMAMTTAVTMVTPLFDDGDAFLFQFQDDNNNTVVSGFIHRPFSASAVDSMTTPPITFSESSDLGSWLETIKYAVRN